MPRRLRKSVAMSSGVQAQTSVMPPSIEAAVADAAWLAHRYDPGHDAVHLLHVTREDHRRATFLTDEYLPGARAARGPAGGRGRGSQSPCPAALPVPLGLLLFDAAGAAFDRPGWAGRAEGAGRPQRHGRLAPPRWPGPDMAEVLDDVLTLLARPFVAGEAVVVKPSNIVNGLAPAILTLRPGARALLLHAPLRTYLGSVAKKGLEGRLWVRTLMLGLLDDKLIDWASRPATISAIATSGGRGRLAGAAGVVRAARATVRCGARGHPRQRGADA
jgi:hypothetical protein